MTVITRTQSTVAQTSGAELGRHWTQHCTGCVWADARSDAQDRTPTSRLNAPHTSRLVAIGTAIHKILKMLCKARASAWHTPACGLLHACVGTPLTSLCHASKKLYLRMSSPPDHAMAKARAVLSAESLKVKTTIMGISDSNRSLRRAKMHTIQNTHAHHDTPAMMAPISCYRMQTLT